MEQHDAALFPLHLLQHPLHDRFGHRVGPVHRIDVPHDRLQPGPGQQLHAFGIAGAVGEAEQRGPPRVDFTQQGVGVHHLVLQRRALAARELGMAEAVVAQGVAIGTELAADAGHRAQPGLAILAHRAQVAANLEEHRRHVVALEDGGDFLGVGTVRAVIETEHHGALGQGTPEQLALAVIHRHRVRLHHAEVAQDGLAAVQAQQVGLVIGPFFALQFDRPGPLEAAEDLGELGVVAALDLVQCAQVFLHPLAQLDRRQRGVRRQPLVQVTQYLDKGQTVGVIHARVGFDVIQQAGQGGHALRPAAVEQGIQPARQRRALFQCLVEQLLPYRGGGGAIGGRLRLLVGQQHDDPPVFVQQLLQLVQQGRVNGRGGRRDCIRGRRGRLLVTTGHQQRRQQQPGYTAPRAEIHAGDHVSAFLAAFHAGRL